MYGFCLRKMTSGAYRISSEGTTAAEWDRNTWPELEKIARYHPEAGVHFQGFKFALPGLPQ